MTFRIDPQTVKKLKFLAVEQDKSLTELFLEASGLARMGLCPGDYIRALY